jgi:metal-responsive CopG/Arc/MetJ family transcriptional regulator
MSYAQVVEMCCRDLRRYLEYALVATRGNVVTVKTNRVLQVAPLSLNRKRYSWCLSQVLRQWRWNTGVYVVPRRDVEMILSHFNELCASVKHVKREERVAKETVSRFGGVAHHTTTVLISFHIPRALLRVLDEYARQKNLTRSDVVRMAIQQLIEKYKYAEVDLQCPATLAQPVVPEDELVSVTFHETRYMAKLLDMYVAKLQTSRSDVVRTAIQQMLDKIRAKE